MTVGRKDIETLIRECRLTSCLECGKCTAICPLSVVYGDDEFGHLPRGIIEMALADADLVMNEAIWHCLTCDVCTVGCPSGVKLRDFVAALRRLALAEGYDRFAATCSRCGGYFLTTPTRDRISHTLASENIAPEFLQQCPRCRSLEFSKKVKDSLPGNLRVKKGGSSP